MLAFSYNNNKLSCSCIILATDDFHNYSANNNNAGVTSHYNVIDNNENDHMFLHVHNLIFAVINHIKPFLSSFASLWSVVWLISFILPANTNIYHALVNALMHIGIGTNILQIRLVEWKCGNWDSID